MKLVFLLSSLALLGLLTGAQAAPIESALQLDASSGRIALHMQPHFRTDVEFPAPIVRITGTGAPYRFAIRGRVLSLHAVPWLKGDPRFSAPCSLNVFLAGRAYQVDVVPDWNQSQHLVQVVDSAINIEPLPAEPATLSQGDRLFLAFIARHGHLSGAPERSAS
ncbi:MAG TPA: hypothetical protein VL359_04190, partial [bacterium]|nr:hypothetical protein [bacterium]